MPLLRLWAFVAYSRATFTFTFLYLFLLYCASSVADEMQSDVKITQYMPSPTRIF